jgi:hypothetical protein
LLPPAPGPSQMIRLCELWYIFSTRPVDTAHLYLSD